ncbi:pilus assembly protein FlpE [Cellulomonas avistercoris]|uniref:pilus assembly protein FlpE n=1 Tax=Cellulomonas avistercoris TaxID=2762242 RepID=UPI001CD8DECC|nr:pilus assembly protein FlpE [Cellulomonas avistercoris]
MQRGRRAVVVGVVGAAGGVGASTLAALVARRLSRTTSTALVDLDRGAGGLDVVVGIEEVDGARWPDLHGAGGDVRGSDVVALLPRWGACAVLSADRTRPTAVEPGVRLDVLHALACEVGALVLDLDRGTVVDGDAPLAACDAVVVAARADLRCVAGALALRPRLDEAATRRGLVVRTGAAAALGPGDVAAASGLDVWHVARHDRALAARAERVGPGGRGPAARSADAVVRRLGIAT